MKSLSLQNNKTKFVHLASESCEFVRSNRRYVAKALYLDASVAKFRSHIRSKGCAPSARPILLLGIASHTPSCSVVINCDAKFVPKVTVNFQGGASVNITWSSSFVNMKHCQREHSGLRSLS
ncbi:hypothetical protein KIN20_034209 [Parelaphostrongylus tenuis]|uniref:Uncharacterized protein n=1 Tax=Parelaphostrongylus tenuis TaxID=148309 RepID=A0AAD5R9B6_PARTN|nr:hypothetical protein KIN20_034209 [Parelaphostrongylus tenuis]